MKKISLVALTSFFQFYVFLACIKNNKKTKHKYIILFNNIQISSETIEEIKNIIINENIIFLDLRNYLKGNLILNHKDYVNFIISKIKTNDISDIFLRYKLNTPERILINLFPNAKLNFFEDGLGDYVNPNLFKGFKKKIEIKRIIKENLLNFIFQFSNNSILKNFYNNRQLKNRVNFFYELLTIDSGHLKNRILKYTNKRINISLDFKELIDDEYKKKYINLIKKDSFLVLGHPFLHSYKFEQKLQNEINIYIKIFKLIKSKYNNINIIYKPHPKTPVVVNNLIIKKFPENVVFVSKDILSDFLIINKKSLYLGSFLSSSLIYAHILNKNIKTLFLNIENLGVKEFDAQIDNMKIICSQNNIETFNIN